MNASAPTAKSQDLLCPTCNQKGIKVKPVTLQSLLTAEAKERMGEGPYRFCESLECDTVYYSENGGERLTKADLTVRVGVKETEAPRHVCYCLDHTIEEIEDEVKRTGQCTVPDDIKTRMKEACWCETKSPRGSCCLATVNRYVKQAMGKYGAATGEGEAGAAKALEDCCLPAPDQGRQAGAPGKQHSTSGRNETGDNKEVEDCCAIHGDCPAAVSSASAVPGAAEAPRLDVGKLTQIGALVSAILASACCWLPLLLLAVGVSGGALSATFEAWRPVLLPVTFALLGAAFYFTYRKPKVVADDREACCVVPASGADDKACCPAPGAKGFSLNKLNKVMLWVVTAFVLSFAFFPNYVGTLLGDGKGLAANPDLEKVVLKVEGMTCEGCAANLRKSLSKVPGIAGAEVSHDRGQAIVGVPRGNSVPRETILAAVSEAGFKGSFADVVRKRIAIEGMTCEGCAVHIQSELAKIKGVSSAVVEYKKGEAFVISPKEGPDDETLKKAVEGAGYKVKSINKIEFPTVEREGGQQP